MTTKNVGANTLKAGSYLLIDGAACRVGNIQVSRPGKHGHAKMRVEGVGIVDGKKRIIVIPGHDSVEVPVIGKNTAQVCQSRVLPQTSWMLRLTRLLTL